MEAYDPALAAQVWKRVRGDAGPPREDLSIAGAREDLTGLIAGERGDAAAYLQLSRRFSGKEAAVLRQMSQDERAHAACLGGMYFLSRGERPAAAAPPPAQESIAAALRKCYGREMQCLAAYEGRVRHPEYGPVFARLAEQEREHCRQLLILLGGMGETG